MTSNQWTIGGLAALGVISVASWHELSVWQRSINQAVNDEPDSRTMQLSGVVTPAVTTPISATVQDLTVPLGAWVRKGQIIGTDACFRPEQDERIEQAQARLDQAAAAVASAETEQSAIEAELTKARARGVDIESQLISSETGELQAEQELRADNRLLRVGSISEILHDRAVQIRDSAQSAVVAAEGQGLSNSQAVSALELQAALARTRLAAAVRRREIEDEALQKTGPGQNLVVAPADGVIVPRDLPAGAFGIAEDPARLTVRTQVPASDIGSIRVGQKASVTVDGQSGLCFDAKIGNIAGLPVSTPGGAVYEVGLHLDAGAGVLLTGTTVTVQLQMPAR